MLWHRLYIVTLLCLLLSAFKAEAQDEDCNQLGVWLWHIETTGFSHEILANNLARLGVKRVYAKVADGRIDSINWPELIDLSLVNAYHSAGLEVWAWSYNYNSNYDKQAEALSRAAQTGYDGYVVDVEMEFDGKAAALDSLFSAFFIAREKVIEQPSFSRDSFPIYCTTWGNPKDHFYSIESIDPYVDGYMPQTYVEYWGQNYLDNISYFINEGNKEYRFLGATKPIHHIASTATEVMTADMIDEFIAVSGPATSLWRIPGGGVSLDVWRDWGDVNWTMDFCQLSSTKTTHSIDAISIFPNPTTDYITASDVITKYRLYDYQGRLIASMEGINVQTISLVAYPPGLYFLNINEQGPIKLLKH